jgi:hypothetical protein
MGNNASDQRVIDPVEKSTAADGGIFTVAVIKEIGGGSGAAASRAQQVSRASDLLATSSTTDFPTAKILLASFVQDGKEQPKSQEKPKSEPTDKSKVEQPKR